MGKTRIEWCDITVNPFTGCRHNCSYCFARRMARRLASIDSTPYSRVCSHTDQDAFAPAFHLDVLQRVYELLRRKRGRRVFVGLMGDMCFDGLALTYAEDGSLFGMDWWFNTGNVQHRMAELAARHSEGCGFHDFLFLTKRPDLLVPQVHWPRNVYLGVSVTGHDGVRPVKELLAKHNMMTCAWDPRMILWASVEPLLNPDFDPESLRGLDWVVVGAQTGPGSGMEDDIGMWQNGDKMIRKDAIMRAGLRVVDWCRDNAIPCFAKDNIIIKGPGGISWPRQFPRESGWRI